MDGQVENNGVISTLKIKSGFECTMEIKSFHMFNVKIQITQYVLVTLSFS